MPDDTDLETRAALPDALRALAEDWPRAGWEAHPHFDGLVRFWMERHMMFRKLTGLIQTDVRALLDGAIEGRDYASRLSRFGGILVSDLHMHHQVEDTHYFPKLSAAEPGFAAGFEILDRDHHAIDAHLDRFVKGANAVLTSLDDPGVMRDRAGRFEADFAVVVRMLDRHLCDEEELVVPVILKHGPEGLDG